LNILASVLAFVSLVFGGLHFVRFRGWLNVTLLLIRVLPGALAPVWALFGLLAAAFGLVSRRPLVAAGGLAGLAASGQYMARVGQAAAPYGIPRPAWPAARPQVQRDIVIHTTVCPPPAGEAPRPIYADLWLPGNGIARSGVGVVYLHGSAWYLGDKGQMTDGLFRPIVAEGHVLLDVAYRMCPETDLRGMVADAQAAVAWLQDHAAEYGLDPRRIVLSGTSAGGHIALLAAYTMDRPDLRARELVSRNLAVAGVFTISAPVHAGLMLEHNPGMIESAHPRPGLAYDPLTDRDPLVPPGPASSLAEKERWNLAQWRRVNGLLRDLLGGGPDDVPEMFALATVETHVRRDVPPTLLIQGDQDMLVPVKATRLLHQRLQAAGADVSYLELPQTEHGFDLAFVPVSPPAQAALQAIRRFLTNLR
jgi:acetyl esterase/lipase